MWVLKYLDSSFINLKSIFKVFVLLHKLKSINNMSMSHNQQK
jgi:hypothetical protein